VRVFGVEGTGCYGAGLARYLRGRGHQVIEVNRPDRATRHRRGKSDPIDAEMAARSVLSGVATGTPKTGDGTVEMLRMLKLAKDSAVKSRTQAVNQIRAVLVTALADQRQSLAGLPVRQLLDRCAALHPGELTTPTAVAKHTLGSLARRNLSLGEEIKDFRTRSRGSSTSRRPRWSRPSASEPTAPPPCLSPPATTRTGCARRPRTPRCAE